MVRWLTQSHHSEDRKLVRVAGCVVLQIAICHELVNEKYILQQLYSSQHCGEHSN